MELIGLRTGGTGSTRLRTELSKMCEPWGPRSLGAQHPASFWEYHWILVCLTVAGHLPPTVSQPEARPVLPALFSDGLLSRAEASGLYSFLPTKKKSPELNYFHLVYCCVPSIHVHQCLLDERMNE